jgi:localization factor PodJL
MKPGVPWSVDEIPPEARETATEAARRSGMSLAEWLNSTIIRQAGHQGVQARPRGYRDDDSSLAAVNERIDSLSRRIEQLMRTGPEAYAPKHAKSESDQIADLVGRLNHRLDPDASRTIVPPAEPTPPAMPNVQLPPSLDRAVVEFSARQRALNGEPAAARPQPPPVSPTSPIPAPRPPRVQNSTSAAGTTRESLPAQNLSGLEHQLRNITDRIETLRTPSIERAINALRGELAEIGHSLNEAMPRHSLDAIEKQIQDLGQRIAEGRQAGADGSALAGIEHGLAEVRDALRYLTPAENLVGYNEAIAGVARKIDLIVAQRNPESFAQLENAITTLRGMASNIASNEAIDSLAAQVQALSEKIDHIALAGAGDDTLNSIGQRIAMLSDALTERAQYDTAVPPRIEALVESLADKIERIENSRDNNVALGHLEDRIVSLVERLDASDSRVNHLEAIERGLADLLINIEDLKANKFTLRANSTPPGIEELKNDIARTQDALDALHATLDHVVDRLATIERDIRSEAHARAVSDDAVPDHPFGKPQPADNALLELPRKPPTAPSQVREPEAIAQPLVTTHLRLSAGNRPPIDPNLPPDQPLEPGSGMPQSRNIQAARIAVSEADLGRARPAAAALPGAKSSFIAAARRAAQAAGQQPPGARASRTGTNQAGKAGRSSLRTKMVRRVKPLFIAASLIACVIGSIQIAGPILERGHTPTTKTAKIPDVGMLAADTEVDTNAITAAAEPKTEASSGVSVNVLASPNQPGNIQLVPPAGNLATGVPLDLNTSARGLPPLLNPPMLETKRDVTGSVPRPAANSVPAPAQSAKSLQQQQDELPEAIGGTQLRSAATSGDAAAAYEIAARFAAGQGVPMNMEEAARWFERAAGKGLAPAQFRYASMLEKGTGVKKNLTQARRLYIAAAAKGNAKAMHNLAVLFAEGIDGKPDYPAAAKWFRKAADLGISDSQYNLGILTARGLGVEANMADSYKWFALAAAHGDHEAAKKRDEVAAHMDAKALAAAKQAVATFKPVPQPEEAVKIPAPAGGWDHATAAPAPKAKPQSTGGPLALDTFTMGKR